MESQTISSRASIIVQIHGDMTPDEFDKLHGSLRRLFGKDRNIVFLNAGVSLTIVEPEVE